MEPASTTIDKALDVLFHLHGEGEPAGVSAIGRALGLPKSTTHRLLAALAGRGLVERDARGRYRPGIALVALGVGVLEHEPVVAAAQPVLEETALRVGETIFLAAARGGRLIVLDKCEGSGFLRASPRIGAEIPAHATAIGKVYLAFAPEQLEETGRGRRRGPSAAELERQLDKVRQIGAAAQSDEWIPGLAGVAAPIAVRGRLVAALAIAGASSRFAAGAGGRLISEVRDAASAVADRLRGARLGGTEA